MKEQSTDEQIRDVAEAMEDTLKAFALKYGVSAMLVVHYYDPLSGEAWTLSGHDGEPFALRSATQDALEDM